MRILLDTNVIIRAAQPTLPSWATVSAAMAKLVGLGFNLCIVPQNIYEFWVVATRPVSVNGFGLDTAMTAALIEQALANFTLLRDERGIYESWKHLVQQQSVLGKLAHDTRLVAAMKRHSITTLLTMNKPDFNRFGVLTFSPTDIVSGTLPVAYATNSSL